MNLVRTKYQNRQLWPTEDLRQEMNLCRKEGRLIWRWMKAELNRREKDCLHEKKEHIE